MTTATLAPLCAWPPDRLTGSRGCPYMAVSWVQRGDERIAVCDEHSYDARGEGWGDAGPVEPAKLPGLTIEVDERPRIFICCLCGEPAAWSACDACMAKLRTDADSLVAAIQNPRRRLLPWVAIALSAVSLAGLLWLVLS